MSQWYIWLNPYTNLAPTLTPSPNGLKLDYTLLGDLLPLVTKVTQKQGVRSRPRLTYGATADGAFGNS
jgi:hypothetical protein